MQAKVEKCLIKTLKWQNDNKVAEHKLKSATS